MLITVGFKDGRKLKKSLFKYKISIIFFEKYNKIHKL